MSISWIQTWTTKEATWEPYCASTVYLFIILYYIICSYHWLSLPTCGTEWMLFVFVIGCPFCYTCDWIVLRGVIHLFVLDCQQNTPRIVQLLWRPQRLKYSKRVFVKNIRGSFVYLLAVSNKTIILSCICRYITRTFLRAIHCHRLRVGACDKAEMLIGLNNCRS